MTVTDLGEHALLARILARLPRPGAQILVGPGDDAAVIAPGRNLRLVVTTDALVEEVHFSRGWSRPGDVGHKALAVNLSDLAAMGAAPSWALLSLALPAAYAVADVEALVDGMAALARAHGVSVAGGNITRSAGGLVVDVTAGGEAAPRQWLTRAGARPGDELWVSGMVGGAAAGLEMLTAGDDDAGGEGRGTCVTRHLRPEPRVRLGLAIARGRAARAAMDLSDGLADAVRQLASASGCGAIVDAGRVPVEPAAAAWWQARGVDPVDAAVAGGEDYELLFAVPPRWGGRLRGARQKAAVPPLTKIGVLTKAPAFVLARDGRRDDLPAGFRHFSG